MPVAFVSGAAQGIGRAIALRLADDGFDIAVNDIPAKDVADLIEALLKKGRKAFAVPADVSSVAEVDTAVDDTVRNLGSLDVMVANAGIGFMVPFLDTTPEMFNQIMSVNIGGVFNCFQSAAKQMIKQGRGGRLIAASSTLGRRGAAALSAYSMSKFAIRGLMQSVATEMGKYSITANCYCPTWTNTPLIHDPDTGEVLPGVSEWIARLPISRLGEPDDVANVVSFLASNKSGFITGQSLSVDGGDFLT